MNMIPFDTISHQWLQENVIMDKEMLKKWLVAGYLEKGELYATEQGAPQGGVISPAFLNVTLSGLEQAIKAATKRNDKVHVIIYADDFIITGATKEVLSGKVKPVVDAFLEERGLVLSNEKTKITHINEGFDFLSVNTRKYKNGKLIQKPAKESVKRFLNNIRGVVKTNASTKSEDLISQLNPKIIGWANYHRFTCAKKTFSYVSHQIFEILWRWAKRRHPDKGKNWIRNKYFRTIGYRQWVFFSKIKGKKGESAYLDLANISKTPIRRHVKIRADATPYDPAYQEYFAKRQARRENKTLFFPCKSHWSAWWELTG